MKQTLKLFNIGLRQTVGDGMLLMLLPAPLLLGALVRWGVPLVNMLAEKHFGFSLVHWYLLIDGFMIALIPAMLSIISAFLLLDERDEGTGAYYQITPVQGYSYLLARLGLPMAWAFLYTIIAGAVFGVSGADFGRILFTGLIGTGAGVAVALMIVALADNRVEGLAISKLMGISLLGIFAVWFIPAPYYYLAAFLPSFWVGVIMRHGIDLISAACGILACALWIFVFMRRFLRKY